MILSLGHVSIRVKDIEISKKFYENILGLKHIRDEENQKFKFSFLQIGDVQLELLQLKNSEYEQRKDGPVDHIAFFVDDLQKEVLRLKEKKVKFLGKDIRKALNFKVMFIEGPDGERIELAEEIHK